MSDNTTEIAQTQPYSSSSDEAAIQQKLQQWRELFSQENFSLSGYEHLFINTDELLVYDSYSPTGHDREIRGWSHYRTLWDKYIPLDFPGWRIVDLEITRLEVYGENAWSTISYVGQGNKNGEEYVGGQHGTHVWRRSDGNWHIVHEHLTTMTEQEVQSRLHQANAASYIIQF